MTPGTDRVSRRVSSNGGMRPWHLAVLVTIAVSHPLADVLVRGPEFFIAYRAGWSDLVWIGAGLFAMLPAAVWLVVRGLTRVHPPGGRALMLILVWILVSLIAWQALQRTELPGIHAVVLGLVAGLAFAAAYWRLAPARAFVAFLSPVLVVAPLLFFRSDPVVKLMESSEDVPVVAGEPVSASMVVVVFDQLPLVSLLDSNGAIDAARFPNFAALAEGAVWYRNTTAISDRTNWALPAILTGRYPDGGGLPFAGDHPGNLFTLLGDSHEVHVHEPLTALCPPRLCPAGEDPIDRWLGLLLDLSIVYGHISLPEPLAAGLPPVTRTWRGFGRAFWQGRWAAWRDTDRRQGPAEWIAGIARGERPLLGFLHALLPHEPFVYLPTGQLLTPSRTVPGLEAGEVWTDDVRLVALQYQRHMLQVQYVDRLLGQILDRLTQTGLYDETAIVVTADHGASFHPGHPFKMPTAETVAGVAAVPFLFKAPGQREGRIVQTPLETIDILPTVMRALNTDLPWPADGRIAGNGPAAGRETRRIYFDGMRRHLDFDADLFDESLRAAAAWKDATINPDVTRLDWPADPLRHLVGTPVSALRLQRDRRAIVSVDDGSAFQGVDLRGDYLPVYVSGTVTDLEGTGADDLRLAVAVNGVIRATSEVTWTASSARTGFWSALVPPHAYRPGRNGLEFFEVPSTAPGAPLRPLMLQALHRLPPNLIEPATQLRLGVTAEGFHEIEWDGPTPFRWTTGRASLSVPLDPYEPTPSGVRVAIQRGLSPDGTFELAVNGCHLFEGPQPEGSWARIFPLEPCGDLGDELTVVFTVTPAISPGEDSRTLGLAIEAVRLIQ